MLWAREAERLDAVADELRCTYGVDVATVTADAAQSDAASHVAHAGLRVLREVDILVLNAGGPPPRDPLATEADEWRAALQLLTVTPIDLATRLVGPMRQRGWGRVVAVLSSGVREPILNLPYSNGGRAALVAWLKTVSRPLAVDGVTVNGVVPGRVSTPRVAALDQAAAARRAMSVADVEAESRAAIPAGRYGDPTELAATAAFLCSEQAGYQTGTLVAVDGGMLHGV
jgi:3-oxoacyl-[acyl-carrier protein] reductase